jgi:LysR family transcriptional regulator, hca operon transcriptional activator
MERRLRRCFVVVAEAGSLTVAAERKLDTFQPPLSCRVGFLKTRFGAQLLTRGARGIELTPGEALCKSGLWRRAH